MDFLNNIAFWQALWFGLIGAALFLFIWLDGFDLGIGMNLPFLKDETQKRGVLNTMWPVWDGNELYGLIGGGAIFATFPVVFAGLLSGLYPWLVLVLVFIMLRPVVFEAWNNETGNKAIWEWLFAAASFTIPFVAGVAIGGTIAGLPYNAAMEWDPAHGFWEALSPFSVTLGLAVVAVCWVHGSTYVIKKMVGPVADNARANLLPQLAIAAVLLVAVVAQSLFLPSIFDGAVHPLYVIGLVLALVLVLGGLAVVFLHYKGGEGVQQSMAFFGSSLIIAGAFVLIGAIQFPTMVRSSLGPQFDLTIFKEGVSNPLNSLQFIGVAAVIALAITAVYTILVFRIFKGKVDHKTNAHY
jgi:cytochrome d ubiquinol oxidase subunit II